MKLDLSGKIALVTGGGHGLGREISLALAETGAEVCLTYNQDILSANSVVEEIKTREGQGGWLQLDVSNQYSINNLVAHFGDNDIGIDILINNAGINIPAGLLDIDPAEWQKVIDTNLTGPWRLIKELWDILNDGASIVNIGSISGHIGGPTSSHYSASKLGLVALTHNVALVGASRGIRCNCLAPGYIQSELTELGSQSEAVKRTIESIPLGRLATYREVAQCALFLASDMSSYMTGSTLHCNGGLHLNI